MQFTSFMELARSRRSVRRYEAGGVSRVSIDELIEAATWAPSAHNRQPWRFAVIEAAKTKQSLATAMANRLRQDLEQDGLPTAAIEADASRSYTRITTAPVVLIACLTMKDMDRYADIRRNRAEEMMATQSSAMAVQNLLLAAHAQGLGTCWMCAPLFVPDTVREVLGLEADWEPQALVTLGYPAESRQKDRLPIDWVVKYIDNGAAEPG